MPRPDLASSSRDAYQAVRRSVRQQLIVERVSAAGPCRLSLGELAREFGVSDRTVSRDVERLRTSGIPIQSHRGQGGGISLERRATVSLVHLDLPEIAALLSSLTSLGPTSTASATSAAAKLVAALGV